MDMISELETLCLLNGISGDENRVRDYIISQIGNKAEIRVDNLGNVIAFCKGEKTPKNKVMVSAHMDEVGMIVTYINSDGTLKISAVGGIDERVVYGRRVSVGKSGIIGVVGGKAVHNLTAEERKKALERDKKSFFLMLFNLVFPISNAINHTTCCFRNRCKINCFVS